jgi:membrane-associated phospholipid phosphatase
MQDLSFNAWWAVGRLGEAEIALPVALALAVWLLISARCLTTVSSWAVPLGLAAILTTVSKIAFLGWGIGIASINFTGFSGHAMFSAAIYPMLAAVCTHQLRQRPGLSWHALAVAAGYALALAISVSRVKIGAHSWSEVVSGFALGAAASGCALCFTERLRYQLHARWLAVGLAGWLIAMPIHAAPSRTHNMVTLLALKLSQRSVPFDRSHLYRSMPATPDATQQ